MPNWDDYETKDIFNMEGLEFKKKKKRIKKPYMPTKALKLLKKRYCKAYKFKFGISLTGINLNNETRKFIMLHPELEMNNSKTSLWFR